MSQSSRHLPPKHWRDYQVTVQSPPPSKILEGLPSHIPVVASLQNTGGITKSQSSRHLFPKYYRDYQVTFQSPPPCKINTGGITWSHSSSPPFTPPPPSKIPEGLQAHSPVAASLQNTRGVIRSQSSRRLPPNYRRDYQVTVQSPLASKIPEGLPDHSPVATFLLNTRGITRSQSSRGFPSNYQRDYQVTFQ